MKELEARSYMQKDKFSQPAKMIAAGFEPATLCVEQMFL